MEIYHTKTPIKIWSGLLGVPNDYREKLIETTYDRDWETHQLTNSHP